MILRKVVGYGLLSISLSAVHTSMSAQTAVDGAIGGTVEDVTGSTISHATVIIHNNATNAEQTTRADDSGSFRVIHLQPGVYTVSISAAGFGDYKSDAVEVTVGSQTTVRSRLAVGSSAQTVEVSASEPIINTTNNDFSNTIGLRELSDLPVNNYRWSAYALQAPGVVESGGFGLLSFRGQSTLLNNITIDGADDNQAFFSEERGRTNIGYSTPKSAIQEFQVNTSNYSTEYGRAGGGVVNAVTKSGSNQFHGEGYFLDRDSVLAAYNDFTTQNVQLTPGGAFTAIPIKPTDIRKQEGFAIGGPILRDKLFFFFALDRFYRTFPIITVPSAPSTFYAVPSPTLPGTTTCTGGTNPISSVTSSASYDPNFYADSGACTLQTNLKLPNYTAGVKNYINGQAGLNSLLGKAPRFADQTLFFPKIDWQINQRNHLSAEVNRLRFISPSGQQTNVTASYGLQSIGNVYARDTWGVARLDTYITSTLSNEIRYQYSRDFEFAGAESPTAYETATLMKTATGYVNPLGFPPNVSITSAFQFGTATFYNRPAYPDERRWQVSDTVLRTSGNHTLKFGVDYIHTNDLSENLSSVFGAYSYTSLATYFSDYYLAQSAATVSQAAHYTSYQQGFGPLGFEFQTGDYAAFIQDEWKINPRVSVTLGLRYEYEKTPTPQLPNLFVPQTTSMPSDKNNIAPRVGFAIDAFGTGKTVVRGGYGMFNARLINSTIYNALAQTGAAGGQVQSPNLLPGNPGAPVFPQVISGTLATSVIPNVIYFDSHFQLPQIHQVDLNVDQDLGAKTVLTLSWLASFGRELPSFVDTNLPNPVNVAFTVANNNSSGLLRNGSVINVPFYGYPVKSPVAGAAAPPTVINFNRPDAHYGAKTDIFSGVTSNYEALVAQIKHQYNHHVQLQASYTWSHALDYGENNTTFSSSNSLLDPRNLRGEYGNSVQNVPNRFILTAVIDSPWRTHGWKGYLINGYEFSPSFSAQNGEPYSPTMNGSPQNLASSSSVTGYITGVSTGYNGAGGSTRIPGFARNAFQLPGTMVLDARVSKRFVVKERYDVEILAEAFNLPNHQNITATNTPAYAFGTATGGGTTYSTLTQYTGAAFGSVSNSNNNMIYTPRQIQLGARLHF